MRKFAKVNKYIVRNSLIALCILILITLFLPEEYNSYSSESIFTYFWVLASASCNPLGVSISLIVVLIILIFSTRKFIKIYHSFIIFFLTGVIILSTGVYFINFLKEKFPEVRPYQEYLFSHEVLTSGKGDFAKLTDAERRAILSNDSLIRKIPKGINPVVYKIWLQEPALSFPSAHAFNSVLIGTIYSCILFFTLTKYKFLYYAPLVWMIFVSISRVVLGFHYKNDVVWGAVMGFCIALLFIYSGALNKIIFLNRKTPDAS